MKEENIDINLLTQYTLEFLEKNKYDLEHYYENRYFFKKINGKKEIKDYQVKYFLENGIELKDSKCLSLLSYIEQKNNPIAYELLKQSLNIPKNEYEKKDYIENLISTYTKNLKYRKNLIQIFSIPKVLNYYPDIILEYLQKNILMEEEKKVIIEYYKTKIQKKPFQNNLEFQRLVSLMNKCLKKPLNFIFFEEKEKLDYKISQGNAIFIQINVKDIMQKFTNISKKDVILVINSLEYLAEVKEYQINNFMSKKSGEKVEINPLNTESFQFLFMSSLNQECFQKMLDLYFDDMLSLQPDGKYILKSVPEIKILFQKCFIEIQRDLLEKNLTQKEDKKNLKKI